MFGSNSVTSELTFLTSSTIVKPATIVLDVRNSVYLKSVFLKQFYYSMEHRPCTAVLVSKVFEHLLLKSTWSNWSVREII